VKARYLCLSACAALLTLGAAPVRAADAAPHPSNQREKFAACAHQSRGMKGDERHAFMSECLKKHDAAHAARENVSAHANSARPQVPCSAEADRRKLQGEERRAFLGTCEKG